MKINIRRSGALMLLSALGMSLLCAGPSQDPKINTDPACGEVGKRMERAVLGTDGRIANSKRDCVKDADGNVIYSQSSESTSTMGKPKGTGVWATVEHYVGTLNGQQVGGAAPAPQTTPVQSTMPVGSNSPAASPTPSGSPN